MDKLVAQLKFRLAHKKPIRLRSWIKDVTLAPRRSYYIYEGQTPLTVVTRIGGEKETSNIALRGDIIVTGPRGEQYILKPRKFIELYNVNDGIATPHPIPRLVAKVPKSAIEAASGKGVRSLTFKAPWGEDMLLRAGDYTELRHGPLERLMFSSCFSIILKNAQDIHQSKA